MDQPQASLSPQRLCSTGSAVVADPAALATYLENETSYAGRWWDQSEASLVVAFTGNSPDRLEQVVRRGTGRVCVVASRYNLSQLSSGAEDIAALAPGWTKAGYVYGGAGVEVQRNRVVVRVAASDKQLREDLRVRFGDLVTLEQFLDLEVAPIRDIALSSADPAAAAASLQPLNATFTYHCGLDSTRSRTQSPANVSPPSASPASTEPNS